MHRKPPRRPVVAPAGKQCHQQTPGSPALLPTGAAPQEERDADTNADDPSLARLEDGAAAHRAARPVRPHKS